MARLSFCNVSRNDGDWSLLITCCNRYCRANCLSAVWPVGICGIEFKKWLYAFLNYAMHIKKCRLPSVLTTVQHPEGLFSNKIERIVATQNKKVPSKLKGLVFKIQ